MTYQDIVEASKDIRTTNIKGKEYAEVNQRIKAFRKLLPDGFIRTELLRADEMFIVRAEVGVAEFVLATGLAYEREGSSQINKTSALENCETSAVGRALGMMGIGIDTAVCSAEEVGNAIHQQENTKEYYTEQMKKRVGGEPATDSQKRYLSTLLKITNTGDVDPDVLTKAEAAKLITELKAKA